MMRRGKSLEPPDPVGVRNPPPYPAEAVQPELPERPSTVEVTTGEGYLLPALIVGLGQVGLTVLQALRGILYERFGAMGRLPCVRLLQIDPDPELIRQATRGWPGPGLYTT